MSFFQYRAADQAGKIIEGVMEAEVEQSVVSRLHEMGCVPLRISLPRSGTVKPEQLRLPLPRITSATETQATCHAEMAWFVNIFAEISHFGPLW